MFRPISVTLTLKVRRRRQRPKRGRITGMIIPRNPPTRKSPAMMVKSRMMARSLTTVRSLEAEEILPTPDERKTRAKTKYKSSV